MKPILIIRTEPADTPHFAYEATTIDVQTFTPQHYLWYTDRLMQSLVIDTNGVVTKLEQKGFSRAQAEGISEVLKELDTSQLVTKGHLEIALAS